MKTNIIIIIVTFLLTACVPSAPAPAPTPTEMPSIAGVLVSSGFVPESRYEADCSSPCTTYDHRNPWMIATVYDNGIFKIFGGRENIQDIFLLTTQLYGQDVTDWIADNLSILLRDKVDQTGTVRDIEIHMKQMDDGARLWITITP